MKSLEAVGYQASPQVTACCESTRSRVCEQAFVDLASAEEAPGLSGHPSANLAQICPPIAFLQDECCLPSDKASPLTTRHTLEATEYRDSLSNQHTESRSKLTARQYAVSSLSCLLGMNDRCAVVSAHLSPPNPSPPVYTHASRDPSVPHSDNHYQSLGQCDGVNVQQQQGKRDSQNSSKLAGSKNQHSTDRMTIRLS
ncbi:unnamed protein product [Dibothriocephalus latus]|uniref:Uncharacterized protein n=1 Tax=Dibothriocephalus latus TaxID=60516 RepID=A0A3P7MR41_DIBLA|nr:unnamed protein product [Dibothriocephalus latus]